MAQEQIVSYYGFMLDCLVYFLVLCYFIITTLNQQNKKTNADSHITIWTNFLLRTTVDAVCITLNKLPYSIC